jgi:hypothetical protein
MKSLRMMCAAVVLFSALLVADNASAGVRVYVRIGPPPPRYVVRHRPYYRDAVWVDGYWAWNGRRHCWVEGRYLRPRRGYVYVPGRWERHRRGWYWAEGYWCRR